MSHAFFRRPIFGFLCILICYVLLNLITGNISARWDLTESNQHSISEVTREKLANLSESVSIRYYASKGDNTMPYTLRAYSEKVEYFLDTLERASSGKVKVVRYDPKPGSDARKTAEFDNITVSRNENQDPFYFGISISCTDKKTNIPFLHPGRKDLLEYDILQAINTVTVEEKETIGVVSSLPVMGGEFSNASGSGKFPEWFFVKELHKSYDISQITNPGVLSANPPSVLVVIHPVGLEERFGPAIDQYLANGGKAVVLLDPYSFALGMIDQSHKKEQLSSTLSKLLDAWGIEYSPTEIVADMNFRSEVNRGFGPETLHTVLDIPKRYINRGSRVTSGVNNLGIPYAGHFFPTPEMAGRLVPLISTSETVSTVTPQDLFRTSRAQNQELMQSFAADGVRRVIAAKVLGALKTAYPKTKQNHTAADDECQLILFGDSDFIFDPFVGETIQLSVDEPSIQPVNDNLTLFGNAVDFLLGEASLIAARSKGVSRYPLTGLADERLELEKSFQDQLKEAREKLQETETQLNIFSERPVPRERDAFFRQKKEFDGLLEQKQEWEEKVEEIEQEIDYLLQRQRNLYQWTNTLGVPVVFLLIGAVLIYFRNTKSRAR